MADPATQLRSTANQNSARPCLQCSDPAEVSGQSEFAASRTAAWNHEYPSGAILGPSCAHSIHSIPDCWPIRIQDADLTRTTLNSGVYIKPAQPKHPAGLPHQHSSRLLWIWPLLTCPTAILSRLLL